MLAWIFGVLLILNLAFFVWGYRNERSLEPPLPPLPDAPEAIRLLSERRGDAAVPPIGDEAPPPKVANPVDADWFPGDTPPEADAETVVLEPPLPELEEPGMTDEPAAEPAPAEGSQPERMEVPPPAPTE